MKFAPGQPVPRTEDIRHLRGGGRFSDDHDMAGQAHAFVVRSPHAHAEILGLDDSAARDMPGVLAVLTGRDWLSDGMGEINGPGLIRGMPTLKRRDAEGLYRPKRPALAVGRVRYVGEPVVLVVAETAALARDAGETIEIDYSELPANTDTALANAQDTPRIWDDCLFNEAFIGMAGHLEAVERAFADAPHIIRKRIVINRNHAAPMEPRSVVAHYDPADEHYTIVAGIQSPFGVRSVFANNVLKTDEHKVRIITGDLGGSFGMKGANHPETMMMAWASKRTGRPVKWTMTRSEAFIGDDHARDNVAEAELAVDDDGTFLAMKVTNVCNIGAFMSFFGAASPTGNVGSLVGPYRTPAMYVEVRGVFTNTTPTSPYRGAGRPEAAYITERMVDHAARHLGLDPAEIRRRNLLPDDAYPYKTPLTFTWDCGEFGAVFEKALAMADYAGFETRRTEAKGRGRLRGIGIAMGIEIAAAPSPETAQIRFNASGSVTILIGSTNHGQGHETIYKQILSDRLDIPPDRIRVVEGDTDLVSFGTGTGGSRTASIASGAVLRGIDKCVAKGRRIAAHLMQADEEDITFADGVYRIGTSGRAVSFAEVAKAAFKPAMLPAGVEPGLYEIATFRTEAPNFPYGAQVCEVEIDPETGRVRVMAHTVVDDVGFEINPMLVAGQLHGGALQGASQVLMENMVYDDSGQLLTGSFMDYAMPRASDYCSFEIGSHAVPTKTNPLGVKGVGESGTVGGLPVMMNAILDALSPLGIHDMDMPATPEKIWQAIQRAT